MRTILALIVLLVAAPIPVLAHDGGAIPADVWSHWNADPSLLIGLLLIAALYTRGAATYRLAFWRRAAFMAGLLALAVALVSPLHALGHALFSAHMLQHLLLILVAAPLLALSRPLAALLRGLPRRGQAAFGSVARNEPARTVWVWLAHPRVVVPGHIVVLFVWHLPGMYDAALEVPAIHALEHASFVLTAALFWWTVGRGKNAGGRALSVFAVMMTSGLLGALMTFAETPWYAGHAGFVSAWGLTAVEDQQLAGLLMWIPAGLVYVVTIAIVMGTWLAEMERRTTTSDAEWTCGAGGGANPAPAQADEAGPVPTRRL